MFTLVLLFGATVHHEPPHYYIQRETHSIWDQGEWEARGEPVLHLHYDGFPYDEHLNWSKLEFIDRDGNHHSLWMDDRPVLIRRLFNPLRRR